MIFWVCVIEKSALNPNYCKMFFYFYCLIMFGRLHSLKQWWNPLLFAASSTGSIPDGSDSSRSDTPVRNPSGGGASESSPAPTVDQPGRTALSVVPAPSRIPSMVNTGPLPPGYDIHITQKQFESICISHNCTHLGNKQKCCWFLLMSSHLYFYSDFYSDNYSSFTVITGK